MAEELFVKCKRCEFVYDKLKNRACPICEPRVRPGQERPPEQASKTRAVAEPTTLDTVGAGGDDGERGARRATALRPVLAFGLGVITSLAYWNHRTGSESLFSLPRPSSSQTTTPYAPAALTEPRPAPAAILSPPGQPPLSGEAIELLDAQAGPADESGAKRYTVRLVNRTANTLKDLRVLGLGEDRKGARVVTDEASVQPPRVGAGREASAVIVVTDRVTLKEFRVEGWVQHVAALSAEPRRAIERPSQPHTPKRPPDDQAPSDDTPDDAADRGADR